MLTVLHGFSANDEFSLLAQSLQRRACRQGQQVAYVADQAARQPLSAWLKKADHWVWTAGVLPAVFRCRARQLVIPRLRYLRNNRTVSPAVLAGQIAYWLAPSQHTYDCLVRRWEGLRVLPVPFSFGPPGPVRQGTARHDCTTIWVHLDGRQCRHEGNQLSRFLLGAAKSYPGLRWLISLARGVSRTSLRALREVATRHDGFLIQRPTWDQYHWLRDDADWLLSLQTRPDLCAVETLALQGCLPLITYRIPPLTEAADARWNALVVPCEQDHNGLWPAGRHHLLGMYAVLNRIHREDRDLDRCQAGYSPEMLEMREQKFQQTWQELWQVR
jgi:hypothetical protein